MASWKGYALSVFKGSEIEHFNVEIVARYRGGGNAGIDVYVARVSGIAVERVGGVPLGASGSPVYIGGKLVGAISGTYPPDNSLVTITPIRSMLSMGTEPSQGFCVGATLVTMTPPAVAGVSSSKALGQLELVLGRKVVPAPIAAPGIAQEEVNAVAVPGGPIGVELMTGDVRVGFIGTITLVRAGKVYAFGHPVTYAGPVRMPLTAATVFDTARGMSPFKVGDIGPTIGTVTQDRSAGILGILGETPLGLVDLVLTVTDRDRYCTEKIKVKVVPIPDQLPRLVLTAVIETFSRAMNRTGQGTANWDWTMTVVGGERLTGSGKAVNLSDIGFAVGLEVMQPVEQLLGNGQLISALTLTATVERQLTLS